ncbi:TldD/PmbA family protein [Candidatus Woesearchaeota archaeon]|nr:TldD/PmbA family protein [Candidatus Woesearchaeota archaeon]
MITHISEQLKKEMLKAGADEVVVITTQQKATQLKFVNNKIAKTGTEEFINYDLFITKNKKILTTSFMPSEKETIKEFCQKNVKLINYLPPNKNYKGLAEGPFKYRKIEQSYDPKIEKLGEKAVDIIEEGINAALTEGAKRVAGNLELYSFENFITTSHNVEFSEKGTKWYSSVRALVDQYATGHMTSCGRMLPIKIEETASFAGEIAKKAKNPQPGVEGKFDLIFEPLPLANLFNLAAYAASIFEFESGLSFLTRLNERFGSEKVTLADDATLPNGFNSTAADLEGVPTRRNIILDKGIFKTYLHNTSTARRYKTQTTGNAGLISPGPWNVWVAPGDHKKEELFKEIKRGVYITNIWYTRFQNYITGEFSTIPRDGIFLIKNGKIEYPIKEIRIKSTMPEFLKNISALSNKQHQIKSWEADTPTFTPAVLVKNITITKPK